MPMRDPENRWQLFMLTWRTQKALLLKISLAVSLFAIPLFFVEGLRGVGSSYFEKDLTRWLNMDGLLSLLYIPAMLIFSVGLCGSFGVMKSYTFREGTWFFTTFRESLKENWKEALKLTLLFSVLYYLIHFAANFLILQAPDWQIAILLVEAAVLILWLGAYVFGLCQIPIYQNSTLRTFKNAWMFTFARLPKLIMVLLGSILPLKLVSFLGITVVSAAVLLLYIIIGFGHSVLLISLFCQSAFDEIVNRVHYPQIYRKGLLDPEDLRDEIKKEM